MATPIVLNVAFKPTKNLTEGMITKTVGRQTSGSGFNFFNRKRDMDFSFARPAAVKRAVSRLRKKYGRKISIALYAREGE